MKYLAENMTEIHLECRVCGYEYANIEADNPVAQIKEAYAEARRIKETFFVSNIPIEIIIAVIIALGEFGKDAIQTADSLGSLIDRLDDEPEEIPDNSEITCPSCGESYQVFDIIPDDVREE
jgi:rubredoxin